MEKLTKLERYTAYCILHEEAKYVRNTKFNGGNLQYFDGGYISGICELLANIIEDDSIMLHALKEFNLSELLLKKPNNSGAYWFDTDFHGWDKRIELLEKCIEETHP